MSLAYRIEDLSREEMAAQDPYEGRGVFLAAPGVSGPEMLRRLAVASGAILPAIAWDGIGAWADPGSSTDGGAALLAAWQEEGQRDP